MKFKANNSAMQLFSIGQLPGRSPFRTEQYVIISVTAVGTVCCLVLALYLCNNRRGKQTYHTL